MSLLLEVDLASSVPVFEQIRLQVVAHVAAGRLTPGDHLPTIRALATDLGVAAGTVARAYRDTRLISIGGGADEIMLGIIAKLMGILPGKRKHEANKAAKAG